MRGVIAVFVACGLFFLFCRMSCVSCFVFVVCCVSLVAR